MDIHRTAPDQRDDVPACTILGALEIRHGGVDHAPRGPKVLQLLGLLLVRPGRVVSTDAIVEELWGDRPPPSVRGTMQTHVYHLRRALQGCTPLGGEPLLVTRPPGYLLRVHPDQVDVTAFRRLCRAGGELLADGRPAAAAHTLTRALALWNGRPLGNVDCGPVLSRAVVELREQQRAARHLRIEADLARGAAHELTGELHALCAAERLDEGLHGQLVRALAGAGRRSEGMAVYRSLRTRLVSELGVEPSAELQRVHRELLGPTTAPRLRLAAAA